MQESITLRGQPYLIGHPRSLDIKQGTPGQGIVFHVGKQDIQYNLENLFSHKVCGARMNKIADSSREDAISLLVPEHIVSLVVMHSLVSGGGFRPDIDVCVPHVPKKEILLPVLGPGIQCDAIIHVSQLLRQNKGDKKVIASFDPTTDKDTTYMKVDGSMLRTGEVHEHTTCVAKVTECVQHDVSSSQKLGSTEATVTYDDVDPLLFSARAMGRLSDWKVYCALKIASLLSIFNGITARNYFIAGPFTSSRELIARMQAQFRSGKNEHAYHTLVADFPGELAALAASLGVGRFHAEFLVKNMTHADRLTWLKDLKKNNIFSMKKTPMHIHQ